MKHIPADVFTPAEFARIIGATGAQVPSDVQLTNYDKKFKKENKRVIQCSRTGARLELEGHEFSLYK